MGHIATNDMQEDGMAAAMAGAVARDGKKISLNFRRVTGEVLAGINNATLGIDATQPAAAAGQMPETPEELRRDINKVKTFLNDRDFKMRMADKAERIEKLEKENEELDDQLEEIKKKFTLTGIFSRRKEIAQREEDMRMNNAELSVLKEEEGRMRKARDAATRRLEEMEEKLGVLEGRPPKPKKMRGFSL